MITFRSARSFSDRYCNNVRGTYFYFDIKIQIDSKLKLNAIQRNIVFSKVVLALILLVRNISSVFKAIIFSLVHIKSYR
jgi:hypothetical protein